MFLILTFADGTSLRVRSDAVEAYGLDNTNNANAFVSTSTANYQVRDTVEEIDAMFGSPKPTGWR
jgi:hypothetical protein